MGRVVVVGAGLAGLVAAERISATGREVVVLEASSKAGGRCRSYHDERLGRTIDNGNHLILSANRRVLAWADRIGGAGSLEVGEAVFPFVDLRGSARFVLTLGRGPWGGLRRSARPPGVSLAATTVQMLRLGLAGPRQTVADAIADRGPLWRGFWDPMTRAILNEPPERADAGLLRATMLRSFAKGSAACRPVLATGGLGPALIDPALALLAKRGVDVRLRAPVRALGFDAGRVVTLALDTGDIALGSGDDLILALPAQAAAALLPGVALPGPGQPIVNAHFLVPDSGLPPILGLLGGAGQWLFRRGDVVSATVSAAHASPVDGMSRDAALALLWREVVTAVHAHGGKVPGTMPVARLLRERAATFDQSPAGAALRVRTITQWPNVVLAGDHVRTGLPATLEGAVISGEQAARAVGADRRRR